jgi:preprotein translocase subunit SecY
MALIQSFGIYFLLNKQGVISQLNVFDLLILMLSLTVGSMILVWLGELVTEYGIGNGISLLIFVGIIGRLPIDIASFVSTLDASSILTALVFLALTVLTIAGVVMVNEGTRNIVIEYGRRGVSSQKVTNYLPIKINQAGVIPIIFAVSVVMLPSIVATPLQGSSNVFLQNLGSFLAINFNQQSLGYNILYFALVVGFTYFYTFVQFNPEKIADDVKKRGGFIPGIRPGSNTTKYLGGIVNRITLAGALFLGAIAIMPFIIQQFLGVNNLSIGGTGLLIVVSVVLETIRQVQSMTATKSYENYLR